MNLRPKTAVTNKNYLVPNVSLNFAQNTSFSIVLKFSINLLRFCEHFSVPNRTPLPSFGVLNDKKTML